MKPILKYQFDQLMKQFLLLQDHAVSRTCPYSVSGDYCIRKHLMTIEAYCEETLPMVDEQKAMDLLESIEGEARVLRNQEEAMLCGENVKYTEDLCGWARARRKDVEPLTLVCQVPAAVEEKPGQPQSYNLEERQPEIMEVMEPA